VVYWVLTPRKLVGGYRNPRETLCLYPYPTHFNSKDEGRKFPRNVGVRLQDYTVSQPRNPQPESYLAFVYDVQLKETWILIRDFGERVK
jgi:hypothetical protein